MNTIFILKGHMDYEGFTILGIFDSKEKADEYERLAKVERDYFDSYSIDEYEVE